jgi:hypothetical protein
VHVIVRFDPDTAELCVQCNGLNPVHVDTSYQRCKLEKGGEARFRRGEDIKINIAGYVVIVESPDGEPEGFTTIAGVAGLEPPTEVSMFCEPEKRSVSVSEQEMSVSDERDVSPITSDFKPEPHQEIQIYHDKSVSPSSSLSPVPESVPAEINPALLDSLLTTLIFTEVKPTPLPRLISDLTYRLPDIPSSEVQRALHNTPCVGIVYRSGKDAAGKELSNEYYYIAESITSPRESVI